MKIGEMAAAVGIPASTIRYYERVGLIQRTPRISGRRNLNDSVKQKLKFIKLAKCAGFSLQEIRILAATFDAGETPGQAWLQLAHAKRAEVQDKIQQLKTITVMLDALLSCECETMEECLQRAERADGFT